jgi:serine/threonine-protein kinase
MADVLPSDELIDEPSDYGSLQPGTRLGRYELLVPIARGGMARVWAARLHGQRGFQKLVAIKTILPHLAEEPEFERMFLDEARIASGVHHPNVCEIYELGEEKRTLYLAMEWVSGDSLARVLRSSGKTEPVDSRVVARIVADACAGLHAAHELTDEDGRPLGVVHRDLSPHNILLTGDGTAKVADFGVAKALGQLHEATSAGQLKGKIAYMAPEQVTGNQIDRRSDVFSLGCVLYEATTGQRPFRGDGDHQVMHAVLKGDVPAPTSFIRGYPQELERIVLRALSPQPILRYPTAERMRFALEEFVARGQLVTTANVAQVVRARIGEQIDRRKERIRQASSAGDREGGWVGSDPPGTMTPSNQAHGGHRSGVKASGGARPQIGVDPLASSATIPQASPYVPGSAPGQSHTPVSHPGAALSYPGQSHPGASYPQAHAGPFGHSPTPPPIAPVTALAQTALMPQAVNMPPGFELPDAGGPPSHAGQMRPFSMAPLSSAPPGSIPLPPMHLHDPMQMHMQQQMQQPSLGYPGAPPYPQGAPFDPQAAAPAERPSTPPAGTGQYVIAIAVGVLLAALIGVGGFFAWRGRHAHAPATEPVVMPTGSGAPTAVAAGGSSATNASPTPVSADIAFNVVPADATLSVDGKALAPDVRTVPRPAVGTTVRVVASAKGHEDATVLVDFFSTSPMTLTLKSDAVPPAAPVDPPAGAAPADPPAADKDPRKDSPKDAPKDPPKDPPKKRRPGGADPALPPNPF